MINKNIENFMKSFPNEGLTFDDVSLVTNYADFLPADVADHGLTGVNADAYGELMGARAVGVDDEAVREFIRSATGTSNALDTDDEDPYMGVGRDMFMKIAVGMTGYQLIGGYDTVCEKIKALHDVGVEHVVICFLDPLD